MHIESTGIRGLLIVRGETHGDERGFFRETYRHSELEAALGRPLALRQGNHSRSRPGVLRGFHAEPWDKLVYVVRGTVFAAVADLRPDEATFGDVATFWLGDPPGERIRLFLAEGLGNAFCAVGETPVDYLYDVGVEWFPGVDKNAVAWNDPDLDVDWPITSPVVSAEDAAAPRLRDQVPDHPRWA